jgi:hypothetical protein
MDLIKESPNFFEEGSIGGVYLLLWSPFILLYCFWPLRSYQFQNFIITLFLLEVLVPCVKYSWYKIVIMIFWRGWQSLTPPNSKSIVT